MAYKDLSVKERHAIIKAGVANGVHKLSDIEAKYDAFVDPANHPDYDIESYARENPSAIFNHDGHYPDTYKMPNHPSFSEESIYSTPQTPGGRWGRENGQDYFEPSEWQVQQYGLDSIRRGVETQESNPNFPVVYGGGRVLPEVEVVGHKYNEGGKKVPQRIQHREAEDIAEIEGQKEWLRNWYAERLPVLGLEDLQEKVDAGLSVPYQTPQRRYTMPKDQALRIPPYYGGMYMHPGFERETYKRGVTVTPETGQVVLNWAAGTTSPLHEYTHATQYGGGHEYDSRFTRGKEGNPGYYSSPAEQHARIMELRYINNLDPKKTDYTWEDLQKLDTDPRNFDILRELKAGGMDAQSILDALNTWAYNSSNPFDLGNGRHLSAEGGSIHIAPSKKGTFTAAATNHGKSVQAFASQVLANKENYSPAMVKKANFARNAAHWHDDGGSTKVTKVTAISPSGTWQGYRFPKGSHYATVTEGEYFGLLNDARNMGMNSYDALRYADENVEYNAGLLPEVTVPGTRGLITKSGNSLINQGVIRDANRQRARESGALIYDPNESQRALAIQRELDRRGNEKLKEDASRGFNALLGMAAPSTYYNLAHLDNQLSPGQAFAADLGVGLLTGAGAAALKTASKKMPGIIRRGIEGAMRQGPGPIPNIPEYANLLLHDKDARNYVLKGVIGGRDPKQMFGPYQGLMGAAYESVEDIPYNRDYISAVLYGTPLDERIAQRVGIGEGFGPALEGYINIAYPNKKSNIPVYQLETPHTSTSKVPNELVSAIEDIHPTPYIHSMPMNDAFVTNGLDNVTINVGGYSNNMGTLNGRQVMQGTDIWKFNPDDYSAKWLNKYQTTQTEKQLPFWKKLLYKQGLKVVDDYTTPIITKTAWEYMPTLRSTGGPLYPFSFSKRPLPPVRY